MDTNTDTWSRDVRALAALVLVALLLRLPGLNEALWYDELWSTEVVIANVGDLLRVALYDIHPPAYGAITFAWSRLFGDSEIAIRALPLLCGLATIALMPALGRALVTAEAGWLAGALLALSPVHIWYSQEARAYSMIMLVTVLLVLAWRRFDQEPPSRTARFWFVAGCIAIGQLHYYAIVIPAVLALLSVTRPHRAVVLTGATLSAVFVAVILAVKQAAGALSLEAGYLVTFTPGAAIELFGYWFPLGRMVGLTPGETALAMTTGWIVVIVSTTAMLAWIIAGWRSARRDYWLAHVLLLLAVPGVLTVLLLARREAYYVPRSALPSLPFYVLAVAAAIQLVRHDMARRATIAVTVLASALVFVYLNARRDRSTVSTPNPEWRGIIDPVLALREASGRQLVVFSTTPIRELLYYLPGAGECEWPLDGEGKRDVTGPRARLARTFPTTARPSCGPDGTASIRLYVVDDSTLEWIDSVRTHEAHARPLLLLNEFWEGKTRGVIRALHANGQPLRSIARAKSLEVFEMGPNQ